MKIRKNRELDKITAEKLLSGSLSPDDIPSELAGLARLFDAAKAVETVRADDTGLIKKMSEVIESSTASTARSFARQGDLIMPKLRRLKLSALGGVAALTLMSGLAFAGALPTPAQNAAAKAFDFFGFDNVPAGERYDEAIARSEEAKSNTGDGATAGERNGGASASDVSGQAQDVDTLAEAADLADEASGGHSVTGTSTAEEAATTGTTTSSEAPASASDAGEEAASDGAGNRDRSPR